MKRLYDGGIFASHHQFWVYDFSIDRDDLIADVITELPTSSLRRLTREGYLQLDSCLVVETQTEYGGHWIQIFLSEKVPNFEEAHDFSAVFEMRIDGGGINVESPTNAEPQVRCKLPCSTYMLHVLIYNRGVFAEESESERMRRGQKPSKHSFEGYRLVFVPKTTREQKR
jgi:hypothetical protein